MKEFRTGNAIVRIHGEPNREKLEDATIRFLKASARKRRENNQSIKNKEG